MNLGLSFYKLSFWVEPGLDDTFSLHLTHDTCSLMTQGYWGYSDSVGPMDELKSTLTFVCTQELFFRTSKKHETMEKSEPNREYTIKEP